MPNQKLPPPQKKKRESISACSVSKITKATIRFQPKAEGKEKVADNDFLVQPPNQRHPSRRVNFVVQIPPSTKGEYEHPAQKLAEID